MLRLKRLVESCHDFTEDLIQCSIPSSESHCGYLILKMISKILETNCKL